MTLSANYIVGAKIIFYIGQNALFIDIPTKYRNKLHLWQAADDDKVPEGPF